MCAPALTPSPPFHLQPIGYEPTIVNCLRHASLRDYAYWGAGTAFLYCMGFWNGA